jgi:tagaturonate reductase
MMNLSRLSLSDIDSGVLEIPDERIFILPEKIIQFGTGVLLRALPDYFVDRANRKGIFNGRILVVKSTQSGDLDSFDKQDGLYTLSVRGMESGKAVSQPIISSAISRVINANDHWSEILQSAANPEMQVVISNTTEVGIQFVPESIAQSPPVSFPGKLLAYLYERYKRFNGSAEAGMVIVPTELLTDNGNKLKLILLELAGFNVLEKSFINWLTQHNHFCNSLVDRIVPGKPNPELKMEIEKELGYTDELMIICEPYRLWAIEGNNIVRDKLSFGSADPGMVITDDITKYKELKLRMLNGTHTLCCGLACLADFPTVKSAMDDIQFEAFLKRIMLDEIGAAIPFKMPDTEVREFGLKVLDRFKNPFLEHFWLSITMQYTSKMAMRVAPVLKKYDELFKKPPEFISLGLAAYMLFMRPVKKEGDKYFGVHLGRQYLINDDKAAYFFDLWQNNKIETIAKLLFSNQDLWLTNLDQIKGLSENVSQKLLALDTRGVRTVLSEINK